MFCVPDGVMTAQIGQELHDRGPGGIAWGGARRAARARQPRKGALARHDPLDPRRVDALFKDRTEYLQTAGGSQNEQLTAAIMARDGGTRVRPSIPTL